MRKKNKQSGTLALYKPYTPVSDLFIYLSHDLTTHYKYGSDVNILFMAWLDI